MKKNPHAERGIIALIALAYTEAMTRRCRWRDFRKEVSTMRLRLRKTVMRKGLRKGGFTLIELLVVIAIIGILSAVVLVSLNQARVRGRDGRRLSDLQNISIAMEIYFDQQTPNRYPNGAAGTSTWPANFNAIVTELFNSQLLPVGTVADPSPGRPYGALTNAATNATAYILAADLEQANQACATDYDSGAPFGGTICVDSGPNCAGSETGDGAAGYPSTSGADFCIIQRQ